MLLSGGVCIVASVAWTLDAVYNGQVSQIVEGSIWKGPLLGIVGLAAVVVGALRIRGQGPRGGDK